MSRRAGEVWIVAAWSESCLTETVNEPVGYGTCRSRGRFAQVGLVTAVGLIARTPAMSCCASPAHTIFAFFVGVAAELLPGAGRRVPSGGQDDGEDHGADTPSEGPGPMCLPLPQWPSVE